MDDQPAPPDEKVEFPRLYPESSLPDPSGFAKPPVVRRAAKFFVALAREDFDQRLPSWIGGVVKGHSELELKMREHWNFKVHLGDGPPSPRVTLSQIPQLRRATDDLLIEVASNPEDEEEVSLLVSQARTEADATRFEGFQAECQRWLAEFTAHFGIAKIRRVDLEYRNEITKAKYPTYWTSETAIRIDLLLHVFARMPNPPNRCFRDRFLIDFVREIPGQGDRTLRFRLTPELGPPVRWVVGLHFSSSLPVVDPLFELAVGHGLIYEEFCAQFTEEALNLFRA